MLNKTALCLVVVLGATTAATAATKHVAHRHQTAVAHRAPAAAYQSFGSVQDTEQMPTEAYQSFGSVRGAEPWHEPQYMYIQDQDLITSD
jgi:hypothetical protein